VVSFIVFLWSPQVRLSPLNEIFEITSASLKPNQLCLNVLKMFNFLSLTKKSSDSTDKCMVSQKYHDVQNVLLACNRINRMYIHE